MYTKMKFFAALAVCALLIAAPVHAGILNGNPLAFDNNAGPGAGGAWTGSDVYDNGMAPPMHLIGNIDFAVFTVADFNTAFPGSGYVPGVGDGLIYAYQLENQGDFLVSTQIVGISNVASTIGSFLYAAGDVAPTSQSFDLSGNANWSFSSDNIGSGEDSYILVYSSPNIPELGTGVGVTVDGGTVGLTTVPTPSSVALPEPASICVWGIGMFCLFTRRRLV